jgi:hypothetical protein
MDTTGLGRILLDGVGTLSLKSGSGDISVEHATESAEVTTGSGDVHLRELDGSAVVKNSNGPTWVGEARRDLQLKAANGSIAVDLAHASVSAKSANGKVRLGEVVRGSVMIESRTGDLEVGVREGTAAWLDVRTTTGKAQPARRHRRPRAVGRDRRRGRAHVARRHRHPASLRSPRRTETRTGGRTLLTVIPSVDGRRRLWSSPVEIPRSTGSMSWSGSGPWRQCLPVGRRGPAGQGLPSSG